MSDNKPAQSVNYKLMILGAGLGVVAAVPLIDLGDAITPWLPALYPFIGGFIGYQIRPVIRDWLSSARELGITKLKFPLPGLGDTEISLTNDQAAAVRTLYMELTNRITVQSLQTDSPGKTEQCGLLREALNSIHAAFNLTRDTLKALPAPTTPEARRFEEALRSLLNDVLRPYLCRWHPRLKAWEGNNQPESIWPLAQLCRDDLETTRRNAQPYIWTLAIGLGYAELEDERKRLNIPADAEISAASHISLTPISQLTLAEAGLAPSLESARTERAWPLLVELAPLHAWLGLETDITDAELMALVEGLPAQLTRIRHALKRTPPDLYVAEGEQPLEAHALHLCQHLLHPFAEHYAPALRRWRTGEGETFGDWPEGDTCHATWRTLYPALVDELLAIDRQCGGALTTPGQPLA